MIPLTQQGMDKADDGGEVVLCGLSELKFEHIRFLR